MINIDYKLANNMTDEEAQEAMDTLASELTAFGFPDIRGDDEPPTGPDDGIETGDDPGTPDDPGGPGSGTPDLEEPAPPDSRAPTELTIDVTVVDVG